MNHITASFSGFSVDSLAQAKEFYTRVLGFELNNENMGLDINLPSGNRLFIYEKEDHIPATFTVLNFVVDNIDEAIDDFAAQGIVFERYDMGEAVQDEKGVLRGRAANMGPDIAWFKDPAGNILSILQD